MTTDYEKITVAELARRARIDQKTFYRYYPKVAKSGHFGTPADALICARYPRAHGLFFG